MGGIYEVCGYIESSMTTGSGIQVILILYNNNNELPQQFQWLQSWHY
jgi:hypothetical protein